MQNLICRKLADLASVRIQHRFVRDATAEFYLLPEEVIENAYEAICIARKSTTLQDNQRLAVERFAAVFDSSHPDLTKPDFFDTDPQWVQLRNAAYVCLQQLGFDLVAYENQEIFECKLNRPPTLN